ncbi:MAG: hypothetical protein EBZ47_09320 [Chlamydiae bacterium]|nr:hypothetical protein [Chlamydiota bacterium]
MEPVNKFYEIYDSYTPGWWENPWVLGAALLLLIGAGIGLFLLLNFFKNKRANSPWQKAFYNIKKLDPARYTTQKDFSLYYAQLTIIMKAFLQERFGWHVTHMTDAELIEFLKTQYQYKFIEEIAEKITNAAIGVKFARIDALKEEAYLHRELLLNLVQASIPAKQNND